MVPPRCLARAWLVCLAAFLACTDAPAPAEPTGAAGLAAAADRTIWMLDRCEPTSFNAAVGPGTCVGDGKVTFQEFIATLAKKGTYPQWRFQPENVQLQAGRPATVVNRGGEAHTFTEVEEFGGGIIPDLNALVGETEVAPECLALTGPDFLPPGSVTPLEEHTQAGTELYQCCLHPWMRAELTVR